jgi:chemotaxis protein MotB
MFIRRRTQLILLGFLFVSMFMPGCTNWQRRYEYLAVEHENLKGRYDKLSGERSQMANRISEDQRTIEELTRQIEEDKRTPADATGFGPGYDVAFDAAAGTITVTLDNTILFASGAATLKSATSNELNHILSVLKSKYAGRRIDVVGHTDTDPIKKSKWADNWELSAQRALSVTRYLVDKGIPASSISASGCGSARPVASNASSSGKAKNRRVEIVVHMR